MTDANVVDGLREAAEFYTKRPTIDEQIYVPSSIEMTRQEALELAMTLKTAHSLIISLQRDLAEALQLRDIARENAALWDERRMEALAERDEAVAQQAAMAELLQRAPYDTRATAWAEEVKAALSSLSPCAKTIMEVVAAAKRWCAVETQPSDCARESLDPELDLIDAVNALAKLAEAER